MERALRIEGYRNIGFKDEKPYRERLVINNSLKKGELGDLVILIGANNSGKSNVLSALETFGKKPLQERDVTDLYMEEECRKPVLTLFARNQKKEDEFAYKKTYLQNDEIVYPDSEAESKLTFITPENFLDNVKHLAAAEKNYIGSFRLQKLDSYLMRIEKKEFGEPELMSAVNEVFAVLDMYQKQGYGRNFIPQVQNTEIIKEYNNFRSKGNKNPREIINEIYLYFIEDAAYSFKIDFESERIYFSLFRGGQTVSLDYQSTGFKWFFNLFFNLLHSANLNPGDIIIMDEPATNLHVKGQRELRGFLKNFAVKNDITIVLATHSPFLIDLDYLDELRVVVNKDNISSIENNFAAVNENDPDSLLPIKDSLTVENHILVNPEEKVVFVEGITDYNYLTAFKKLFGKTGITFLPINGLGKTKEECIKISQRLMKIRKKDPVLLVDNDKAGNCIKEVNKDNKDFTIISLSDADANFKTIESLLGDEDLKKFSLIDNSGKPVKHASTSTVFKNQILKNKDEISDETKENFAKLFDTLFSKTE